MEQKTKILIGILAIFAIIGIIFFSGCINTGNEVDKKQTLAPAEVNRTNNNQSEEIHTKEKEEKPEEQMSALEVYCYLKCDYKYLQKKCYDSCYGDFAYNMVIEGLKEKGDSYCDPDSIFNQDFTGFCIQIGAISNRNISLCDKISDSEDWFEKEQCIGLVAAVKKDISLCNEIEYDPDKVYNTGRDECIGKVAMITNETSLCEKTNEILGREHCIMGIAMKRGDVSLCNKITRIEHKEDCILGMATTMEDTSLCEKISTNKDKELCFSSVAEVKEDFTKCKKIADNERREGCILMVAWITQNSSICKEIKTQETKEACFADVASRTRNISICDQITNTTIKEDCIRRAKL